MNVYDVNGYFIAAPNANLAFEHYIEDTDDLVDNMIIDDLEESEEEQIVINIKRLSQKSINAKTIRCCEDGCDLCFEKDEHAYLSLQDLIKEVTTFPYVIAQNS